MADQVTRFYIVHGEDALEVEEFVATLRARMIEGTDPAMADLNTSTFDGATASIGDVFNAAMSVPFLAERRLVIANGWLSWLERSGAGNTGKKTLKEIAARLDDLPDFARLVFVEKQALKDSNPVLKAGLKQGAGGYVKACRQPQNMRAWLDQRAAHYGATLDPGAKEALVALFGAEKEKNLAAADNELFKLAAYVGTERPISEADVAALTRYVPEQSIFDMVDALGKRDGATALALLHDLLAAEKDPKSSALGIFAMIVRQFRLLIQAREHLDRGGGRGAALASALRIHKYPAGKIETQSRNFSLADLEAIYRTLLDLDRRIKTGQIDPVLALDTFVAALAH